MPKTACDHVLKAKLKELIAEVGSCSAVAEMLGLERTMVWRFSQTGSALAKNRRALYDALDAHLGSREKKQENATKNAMITQQSISTIEDFQKMKAIFNDFAQVIDFYEKYAFSLHSQSRQANQVGE